MNTGTHIPISVQNDSNMSPYFATYNSPPVIGQGFFACDLINSDLTKQKFL